MYCCTLVRCYLVFTVYSVAIQNCAMILLLRCLQLDHLTLLILIMCVDPGIRFYYGVEDKSTV